MTKNEKILKRALEMSCKLLSDLFNLHGYKPYTRGRLSGHFIRKAKEELK